MVVKFSVYTRMTYLCQDFAQAYPSNCIFVGCLSGVYPCILGANLRCLKLSFSIHLSTGFGMDYHQFVIESLMKVTGGHVCLPSQ